jgi:uncharacterized protein DUF1259
MRLIASALLVATSGVALAQDWKPVEVAIGRTGVPQPGDVYRFNFPRSDLRVNAAGVRLKPSFALGGWTAFKMHGGGTHGPAAMVMGDLVLTERELSPVMARLLQGGIEVTAIHHHVIRESPRVLYMHVHALGNAVDIAQNLRAAIALTHTPEAPSGNAAPAPASGIDTLGIARALGVAGKSNGGVYQVSVPRADTIRERDFEIPPTMGLATAINFQPTGAGKAAIIGDFVMRPNEVDAVMRALRANGIEVTSLHSHLLNEEPRLFFMHFWANDDAVKLARGLKAALDRTNSRR